MQWYSVMQLRKMTLAAAVDFAFLFEIAGVIRDWRFHKQTTLIEVSYLTHIYLHLCP